MNAEEFVEKHFDVIREALGVYRNKMEDNSSTMGEMAQRNPQNRVFVDMTKDFDRQAEAGKSAIHDFFKLAQKMGKF